MLALRLVRGSRPLVLLRRLLVVAAATGVGLLLLGALDQAVAQPERPEPALARLLWCLVPFAAAVQLAVATARTDPATRPRSGWDAAGLGPLRLLLLAVLQSTLSGLCGGALALLGFLALRRWTAGWYWGDGGTALFAGTQPLPPGAVLVLLALLPLVAGAATALALRPGTGGALSGPAAGSRPAPNGSPVPAPGGLPWGAALVGVGLALLAYAERTATAPGAGLPLPTLWSVTSDGSSPSAVGGWLLVAGGLVLAGPGLTHLGGQLVALGRPGALRLLAGRVLQGESRRLGRPLGALCAVVAATLAARELDGTVPGGVVPLFDPLTVLGSGLALGCVLVSLLSAVGEVRAGQRGTTSALLQLGASRALLRRAAALRAVGLLAVLSPPTWLVAQLATLPLGP